MLVSKDATPGLGLFVLAPPPLYRHGISNLSAELLQLILAKREFVLLLLAKRIVLFLC